MRVFSVKFNGLYLEGFAVVVAEDKAEARALFRKTLKEEHGYLVDKNKGRGAIEVEEIGEPGKWPHCEILWNGDY